jgi:ATP-binding cassette subfamily B protein
MLKTLKDLIGLMGKRKGRIYISLFLSLLDSGLVVAPMLAAFYIVSRIPFFSPETTKPLTAETVIRVAIVMGACVLTRILLRYSTLRLFSGAGYEAMCDERKLLGANLRGVQMGYFSGKNLGDLLATITSDAAFIEIEGMGVVEKISVGIPSVIIGLLVLLYFDYRIALAAFVLLIPAWFAYRRLASTYERLDTDRQTLIGEVTEDTVEFFAGMAVLKTFTMTDRLFYRTKSAFNKLRRASVKLELSHLPPIGVFQACFRIITASIVLLAGVFAITGHMAWPSVFLVMLASVTLFSGAEMMGIYCIFSNMTRKSIDRMNQIKDMPKMEIAGNGYRLDRFDVRFDHVSFAYDTVPVLENVCFAVPEKSLTALVGLSGSGKSTIVKLVARFWDVSGGAVSVGGRDVRTLSYENLLKNISFVFQDVFLFDDTVANNIRIGRPEAGLEDVIEVARRACCHEFVCGLGRGYDTIIGQNGSRLSGGERQRISIARALLKDAPIVLLDEVTANVDAENERAIQAALQELLKDRTVIMIAHKLSTVRYADQILVVENGRITRNGRHEELVKSDGVYKRLWDMQCECGNWKA